MEGLEDASSRQQFVNKPKFLDVKQAWHRSRNPSCLYLLCPRNYDALLCKDLDRVAPTVYACLTLGFMPSRGHDGLEDVERSDPLDRLRGLRAPRQQATEETHPIDIHASIVCL